MASIKCECQATSIRHLCACSASAHRAIGQPRTFSFHPTPRRLCSNFLSPLSRQQRCESRRVNVCTTSSAQISCADMGPASAKKKIRFLHLCSVLTKFVCRSAMVLGSPKCTTCSTLVCVSLDCASVEFEAAVLACTVRCFPTKAGAVKGAAAECDTPQATRTSSQKVTAKTRMADGGQGRLPASPLARGEDPCLCPLTPPSNTTLSPLLPIVQQLPCHADSK